MGIANCSRTEYWLAGSATARKLGPSSEAIAQSASRFQAEVEAGRRTIVGLNAFVEENEPPIDILKIDDAAEAQQRRRMAAMREGRDQSLVDRRLRALDEAARADRNIIPAMLDCARAYCTLFEIRHVLEQVWGAYREPVFF